MAKGKVTRRQKDIARLLREKLRNLSPDRGGKGPRKGKGK